MKKIHLVTFLIVVLLVPSAYAQMGNMMGGYGSQKSGVMMQGQGMMGGMMQNMHQMSGMMQKMSNMMRKDMGTTDMIKMSEIMREMSEHMMNMSIMMKKGVASQEEMQKLHQRMIETEKKIDLMNK